MKKLLVVLSVLVIFTGFVFGATDTAGHSVGVTVQDVAQLRIANDSSSGGAFSIGSASTAGGIPQITWTDADGGELQFTSTVTNAASRSITAEISSGSLTWFTLTVSLADLGAESGKYGDCGSRVTGNSYNLSSTAQDIVESIGTGWTGTGESDGYGITYSGSIIPGSVTDMEIDTYTISVLYTITEEA